VDTAKKNRKKAVREEGGREKRGRTGKIHEGRVG